MSPSPHLHQHTDVYFSDLTQSPGWQPALGLLYMINYVIGNPHWPPLHLFLSPLPLHSHLFPLLLNKSSSQISPSAPHASPPALAPAAGSLPTAEEVSAQRRCAIPRDGEAMGYSGIVGVGWGQRRGGIGQSLNELSGRRKNHITAACVCV